MGVGAMGERLRRGESIGYWIWEEDGRDVEPYWDCIPE